MMNRLAVASGLLVAALVAGCRKPAAARDERGAEAATNAAPAPALAPRAPRGGTDVTFAVVSDTHLGFDGIEPHNERLVRAVNGVAGRAYPKAIGGSVARLRGLVVTGDLTEWGRAEEWARFLAFYGQTGREGALRVPVLEMIGNHDKVHGPWVGERVAERHGGRFYAWTWGDVRFFALGEAPDDEGLAFVERELAALEPAVPLVLAFHLPLAGPWSTGQWFGDGDHRRRLGELLEGRRVLAIFHGHHHATEHYVWRGIDVFKPGAVKHGAHTFAVVHVTDRRMTVSSWAPAKPARCCE